MNLDRNINPDGLGKFALINLRKLPQGISTIDELVEAIQANPDCVEWGLRDSEDEFFAIKLKDEFAPEALSAYAEAANVRAGQLWQTGNRETADGLAEYAGSVAALALRAANHPNRKTPD